MLDELWRNLLTLGNADTVTWLEKIVRPLIVYVALLFLLKMFGKRELAQLNPFDLVVLLILSNTVQNAIIGNDTSLAGGLVGAFVLLLLNYVVVRYFYRHPRFEEFFEGEPTVLIENGHLVAAACDQQEITEPELLAALRRQGYAEIDQVQQAILETSGAISVIPKQPTTEMKVDQILERLQRIEQALAAAPPHPRGA
ncbi:MAG TPA: YetF domain-containing protein [Chloroflexota bacterium]|nr:YetF domain-containing protein [Chloroflexota bacterium]